MNKRLLRAIGLDLLVCAWVLMSGASAWAYSLANLPQDANFELGEFQGSLEGGYEYEDQQTSNAGTPGFSLVRNRFDERWELRNQGYSLIDPGLLEGSAGFDMDFYQEQDKYSGRTGNTNGLLYGYDLSDTIFGHTAYPATFFAHSHETQTTTEFGGTTDLTVSNFGFVANLRDYGFLRDILPYFSCSLGAREDESDGSSNQQGRYYKDDETRDTVNYTALKGFQTADLIFNYQFLDDRTTGSYSRAFQSNWATLNYSLDFGPRLTRQWSSQINYLMLSGDTGSETNLWVSESLHIDHFRNLSTNYQYLLNYTQAPGNGTNTDQTGIFTVQHTLYENLTSALTLQGDYDTLPGGRIYDYIAELGESYAHTIPLGGTFFLEGSGLYEVTDSSISGGTISVIDEPHIADVHGLGFFLKNPFVFQSTIVMYDTRGGGRIPTVRGVDYNVLTVGDLTQIVIIPTSLIIKPGDPLAVSYSYQTAPSSRYDTTNLTVATGLNFSWINASFQRMVLRENLLSGQAAQQFLYNASQNTATLAVHRDWESFGSRAQALFEQYNSSDMSFNLQNYGGHLSSQPGWKLMLGADANAIITDYSTPIKRHSTDQEYQLTLDRFMEAGTSFSIYGRMLQMQDSLIPTETEFEAGLSGRWTYGKFEVVPILSWTHVKYGGLQINDPRLQLVIRRYL